jgi:hypothetical protein
MAVGIEIEIEIVSRLSFINRLLAIDCIATRPEHVSGLLPIPMAIATPTPMIQVNSSAH